MNTVTICASKTYQVQIGSGLLSSLGAVAKQHLSAGKVAVISDSNVWPLYGEAAADSLLQFGFQVSHYVFPAGEASKNGNTYLEILNFLAEHKFTRSDFLIALGGGVVGDLTGFVAATYLRGIPYIQVPTTLLSMVDSSVGGKTAIDLPSGKNLAGAFYQPVAVLCDTDALNTLPDAIFRDGCAEVIKYSILYDADLFAHLETFGLTFDREYVITRCIELKRDVVADDEFDRGSRQKLNLGHTIGHGVEAASAFAVSHGTAVAIGTAIITRSAAKLDFCSEEVCQKIQRILSIFCLPTETDLDCETIYNNALSDKKRSGNSINLIIPSEIGKCFIHKVTLEEMKTIIEIGL